MASADVVEQDLAALTFKGRSDVSPHMLATPKAVRIDEHGDVRANCIDHMHVAKELVEIPLGFVRPQEYINRMDVLNRLVIDFEFRKQFDFG